MCTPSSIEHTGHTMTLFVFELLLVKIGFDSAMLKPSLSASVQSDPRLIRLGLTTGLMFDTVKSC